MTRCPHHVPVHTLRQTVAPPLARDNSPLQPRNAGESTKRDCRSPTRGIRANNERCSSTFRSKCAWMKAGFPNGVPNTTIPCRSGGKSVPPDPRQTRASKSSACAILSNTSHPAGLIPLRFHTCVLPPLMRIRAWD